MKRGPLLRRDEDWPSRILSFLAGPFDYRFLLYAEYILERPRTAMMAHMEGGGNLALVASRQTRGAPAALEERRLYANGEGFCFSGIRPEVYDYEVGGHRVLLRWLRLRSGRLLLPEEATTFCRIATALDLTLAVQDKLAEAGTELGEAC